MQKVEHNKPSGSKVMCDPKDKMNNSKRLTLTQTLGGGQRQYVLVAELETCRTIRK